MKKLITIVFLSTLSINVFAGVDCQALLKEMTKDALTLAKIGSENAFRPSNAIATYKERAKGPGPGKLAQMDYHQAVFNLDEKNSKIYDRIVLDIRDSITKNSECFSRKDITEILNN